MRRATLAVIAGLVASGPALAQTPPRCAILGQMTVSSWLQMMEGLAGPDAATLDPVVARLADLGSLYAGLGCDTDALGAAMDCLLDRSGSAAPRDLARSCMAEAGLSSAQ